MIPMPPTKQCDQGNAEEQARNEADGSLDGMNDLGEVANGEIGGLTRRDPVAFAQHTGDLVHRGRDLIGG